MGRFLQWFDEHILFILTGFLLAFIPLYPKLPLFDVLPGYIVRARLEDVFIVVAFVVWIIQLWRRKVTFGPNPLTRPVLAYLTVGVLSMVSAVFITQTVPFQVLHIEKMVLHYLRRIEYFSLFFIFYSSVKSLKQLKIYVGILVGTIVGVTLYGYGQKYLYWPAFSTMNREFSKGWALYLSEHARVLSTFGGHYDLAAYTMGSLVVLWALFFSFKEKWLKLIMFVALSGAFWLLILTASRTSFIAYLVGVTVLFGLWVFTKGIRWSVSRWFIVICLSIIVMLSFGDLSDRFAKLLKLDQRLAGIKSLVLRPFGSPPQGDQVVILENNIAAVTSKSDFPPLPHRPTDVFEEIPEGKIASQSASGAATLVTVQRTYSQTALVYDLSTGIRLDALWPMAIKGFLRNPLLGSGYSTLTKNQVNDFTEAESTDNDYLRALGETGLLGFLTFGWILFAIVYLVWKQFTQTENLLLRALLISLVAIIIGLLTNAVYIDIFEASKVALSFWAFTGIILGAVKVAKIKDERNSIHKIPDLKDTIDLVKRLGSRMIHSDKTYLLFIIGLAFSLRYHKIHEPLADWHSWRQADTSAVTRNFVRYGINPLFPRYDDLSSVPSGKPNPEGYRFVEFPLYNIVSVITDKLFPGYNVEYSGRLTSIFASIGTLIFLYLLVKKYLGIRTAMITAFFFAVIPYNIFWSRVILPEPTLVLLTTAMLYFFDMWVDTEKKRYWLFSVIAGAAALLVKFTTVFFVFPFAYLVWKKWGIKFLTKPSLYIYGILLVGPFFLWRWHISHYPEGIPAYTWLFNGNGIRFKGAWFWWLFEERISKMILGGWGISLFVIGIIRRFGSKANKSPWIFHMWLLGMLSYLVVFATGNVQHDYYQIILLPVLCVFLGRGADLLIEGDKEIFQKNLTRAFLVISILFMLMFGWYQVRDLYNINHPEIVEAGSDFDRVVSNPRVTVIAPYNGDTAFLYQVGRRGWPLVEGTIDEMIAKGADYYISTNFDLLTNELIQGANAVERGIDPKHHYKIVKQTDSYVIIQLVADRLLPKP